MGLHAPRAGRRAWIVAAFLALAACAGDGAASSQATLAPLITAPAPTVASTSTLAVATSTSTTSTTIAAPTTTTAISTATPPVATVDPSQPPQIDAAAYVVYEVGAQRWLAEQEADTPRPVGSLMKLLTAFVVMQAGDPTHVATVPAMHPDPAESAIGLYEGQRLQRDVLLRAELIVSANDASRTLALDVGGTEEAFVAMMNQAAQALGMVNTVAVNSVGLDADGAHSTPRDMVVIATILMEDPTFRATVARTDARMNGQHFNATNKLLTSYEGATGVKTGHTTDAGYCLVGSATRGDRSVIVAILGAPSDRARIDGASALLDWAFEQ
ncbi:MAG: D-alanyl-D-alanine carboxypeptidase [Ilumatobacteraceae bacterium]|nr:D-alanyl-D-alanine carboxypeptidase [Ilumatobacteraceae bacterium]